MYFCCWSALLYCCCCSCRAAAVRRRVPDGRTLLWFIAYTSSVFFLFVHTRFFLRTRWQYCLIYSLDLPTLHIVRYILVVTGIRGAKALAHRGEAPLVYYSVFESNQEVGTRSSCVFEDDKNQVLTGSPHTSTHVRARGASLGPQRTPSCTGAPPA